MILSCANAGLVRANASPHASYQFVHEGSPPHQGVHNYYKGNLPRPSDLHHTWQLLTNNWRSLAIAWKILLRPSDQHHLRFGEFLIAKGQMGGSLGALRCQKVASIAVMKLYRGVNGRSGALASTPRAPIYPFCRGRL